MIPSFELITLFAGLWFKFCHWNAHLNKIAFQSFWSFNIFPGTTLEIKKLGMTRKPHPPLHWHPNDPEKKRTTPLWRDFSEDKERTGQQENFFIGIYLLISQQFDKYSDKVYTCLTTMIQLVNVDWQSTTKTIYATKTRKTNNLCGSCRS